MEKVTAWQFKEAGPTTSQTIFQILLPQQLRPTGHTPASSSPRRMWTPKITKPQLKHLTRRCSRGTHPTGVLTHWQQLQKSPRWGCRRLRRHTRRHESKGLESLKPGYSSEKSKLRNFQFWPKLVSAPLEVPEATWDAISQDPLLMIPLRAWATLVPWRPLSLASHQSPALRTSKPTDLGKLFPEGFCLPLPSSRQEVIQKYCLGWKGLQQ